uniref:Uncharacterized protein n=1 Tax=Arundo donax TaxID=35708 RepID=A0A0A8ZTG1_ARUDO
MPASGAGEARDQGVVRDGVPLGHRVEHPAC